MENQVLSIEQMSVLSKFGVDITNASMVWYSESFYNEYKLGVKQNHIIDFFNTIPTFTTHDLMMLLPENVVIKRKKIEFTLYLKVEKDSATNWCVSYENDDLFLFSHSTSMLITSLYNMVITCIQEGYIKTK